MRGLKAIKTMFFDPKYYLYFCNVDDMKILIATRDFIIKSTGFDYTVVTID